jgi:hypothetical protein
MLYSYAYDLNDDGSGEPRTHARHQRRGSQARSRGISGRQRITRHLWPMCFGLFIATGYFFLGQQQVFPALLCSSIVLTVPAVTPVPLMIYWLFCAHYGKSSNIHPPPPPCLLEGVWPTPPEYPFSLWTAANEPGSRSVEPACPGYCGPGIRGNHTSLVSPSAAQFADRLRSVSFNAPVPGDAP